MNILFTGDWAPHERREYGGNGRMSIGNLECTFTDSGVISGKAYESILPTACMGNIEPAGFAALSIANNHAYDAGEQAFRRMVTELEWRGIAYFGTGESPYVGLEDDGKKIAVIGCLEPCRSRGRGIFKQEDVASLIKRIRGEFDKVYVYPHWGKEGEYTRYPGPMQCRLARSWIDAGADGVFGSHSHVFQGREYYNGKPIYYSLGNFCFPHPESKLYEGTDVGLSVEIDDDKVAERFVREGVLIEDEAEIKLLKEVIESISAPLKNWTTWKWAKAIGSFNLKKNTASWKIRLRKSFVKTFPKFLAWQFLPKTLLFRAASWFD